VADCAGVDARGLSVALRLALGPRLERLELERCGRGLVDAWADVGPGEEPPALAPHLRSLRATGAYTLTDEGLASLLRHAPGLKRLAVPEAARIGPGLLASLPETCPDLEDLDVSGCEGLFSPAPGTTSAPTSPIVAAVRALPRLSGLRLDRLGAAVDDKLLAALADAAPDLARLSVGRAEAVTEAGLSAILSRLPALEEVELDDVGEGKAVTDATLELLVASCPASDDGSGGGGAQICYTDRPTLHLTDTPTLPPPDVLLDFCPSQRLSVVSLRGCREVSDAAAASFVAVTAPRLRRLVLHGVYQAGPQTLGALAAADLPRLAHLDLSWIAAVTDDLLGPAVADKGRAPALRDLHVWGCPALGARFLKGHGRPELTVHC